MAFGLLVGAVGIAVEIALGAATLHGIGRHSEGKPTSALRRFTDGGDRARRETRTTMTPRALVVYASRKGSTREVADAIAARLQADGLRTVVQPAADAVDLRTFDAVVLGGALYTGRWHRDARRFLRHHRRILATMPLAVFAMGPATTDEHSVASALAQLERALGRTPELLPVAVTIFGGVVDPERLPFPFNRMPASDARDWDAITAWADEVAGLVQGPAAAVGAGDAWRGTRHATP